MSRPLTLNPRTQYNRSAATAPAAEIPSPRNRNAPVGARTRTACTPRSFRPILSGIDERDLRLENVGHRSPGRGAASLASPWEGRNRLDRGSYGRRERPENATGGKTLATVRSEQAPSHGLSRPGFPLQASRSLAAINPQPLGGLRRPQRRRPPAVLESGGSPSPSRIRTTWSTWTPCNNCVSPVGHRTSRLTVFSVPNPKWRRRSFAE